MLSQLKTISRCVLSAHARQLHFCSRTHLAQPVLSAGNSNGVSAASGQALSSLITQSFLKPSTSLLTQTAGIKHVGKLTLRCRHCYFMVKDEQQFVMCTAKARHYQAKKQPAKKLGMLIMTHATQGRYNRGNGRGSRHIVTQQSLGWIFEL